MYKNQSFQLFRKPAVTVAQETACGATSLSCSRIEEKGKKWTNPQYINHNDHYYLNNEKGLW